MFGKARYPWFDTEMNRYAFPAAPVVASIWVQDKMSVDEFCYRIVSLCLIYLHMGNDLETSQ